MDCPDRERIRERGVHETMLLDESPIVFPYFYDFLTGVRKGTAGVETTAMALVQLTGAGRTG